MDKSEKALRALKVLGKEDLLYAHHGAVCIRDGAAERLADLMESSELLVHLRELRTIAEALVNADPLLKAYEHRRSMKALRAKLQDIDIWEHR